MNAYDYQLLSRKLDSIVSGDHVACSPAAAYPFLWYYGDIKSANKYITVNKQLGALMQDSGATLPNYNLCILSFFGSVRIAV